MVQRFILCRRWCCALALIGLFAAHDARAQFPDFGNFGGAGAKGDPVTVEAEFTPATGQRPALVFVTAKIADGFHLYAIDQGKLPDGGGPQVTKLKIDDSDEVRRAGPFQSVEPPKSHIDELAWKGLEMREHEGKVTWFAPVDIAEGVDVDSLTITGELNGQACNANTCVDVAGLKFSASRGRGVELPAGVQYFASAAAESPATAAAKAGGGRGIETMPANESGENTAAAAATTAPSLGGDVYDIRRIRLSESNNGSLVYYLITALAGGLILNVMPCVLPVIGLKVMSFIQQAGESRRRALMLNIWYSAGIIVVFAALGLLAITVRLGWGAQFGDWRFLVVLAGIVFAMALSLMGVWEIPIPGFVGSSAAMDAAHREGPSAAFLKGVLTTILATPCTGPFMVAGLAWAVKQPSHVTMSVFLAVGLGMASPYLLIGAFPSLVRSLPKPGAWMETFKMVMGLLLLGTVVWLVIPLDYPLLIPTFAMLVGITAACWWIGRVPATEPTDRRLRAWAQAVAIVLLVAAFSYGWFYPSYTLPRYEAQLKSHAEEVVAQSNLVIAQRLAAVHGDAQLSQEIDRLVNDAATVSNEAWQSFSLPKLGRLAIGERRTVLVDFTADWCASCKFLEATVLKTDDVTKAISDSGVITMSADYTKKPVWMGETIKALGGIGVPVVAIFPADRPYEPIVFAGGYTKAALLEALAKATGRPNAAQTASRTATASER